MTSHDVVRRMRKICRTRKVGHAGTLDPLATGVLPVAVGQGTKILQFLLAENKSYRATVQFGVTTDTLDREGEVLSRKTVPDELCELMHDVCQRFVGEIEQVPPMYSALKQNGVPLYKLAREGKEVERQARKVSISRLDILSVSSDCAVIEVDCSKGTYIRSLVHDIGEQIGCGAHLTELCRLQSGPFSLDECSTLDDLDKSNDPNSLLFSPAQALRGVPEVELNESAQSALSFGIPPSLETVTFEQPLMAEGALVRLMTSDQLLAVARFAPSRAKEARGDFELVRVFVSH